MSSDLPPIGCFGVTSTGGFFAWVIRKFTRSRYNHAFIVGPNGLLVEADPAGARFSHIMAYPNARYNTNMVLDGATRQRIWDEAALIARNKVPYNWLDVFALGLKTLHVNLAWVDDRIQRSDRLQCAQLVDMTYESASVTLFDDGRLPQAVRPVDLGNLLPN